MVQQQEQGIIFTGAVYTITTAQLMNINNVLGDCIATNAAAKDLVSSLSHTSVSLHTSTSNPIPKGLAAA